MTGAVTTLAGCTSDSSSESSPTPSTTGSQTDSGPDYPETGWVSPENYSEYITSSELKVVGQGVQLDLQMQNTTELFALKIVNSQGNMYRETLDFNRGNPQLLLADMGVGNAQPTTITQGENTLIIEKEDSKKRIPLRLNTSIEVKRVLTGAEQEEMEDEALGIEVKNTGTHPTTVWGTSYSNTPVNGTSKGVYYEKGVIKHEPKLIKPGKSSVITYPPALWRTNRCDEYDKLDLQFNLNALWADNVVVTQTASYNQKDTYLCGSLTGKATTTTTEKIVWEES
ncbi:hypothetical protein EGH22_20500 [Halomicroarcula sp. F28]|uniref:hypothetical protein n=1 Tax=Haloarcula salinisoli TaxID=2487746 RepID=UPI001C73C09A|nr:hypothetical protein [Halomicroarcula salinisoli]MBX0288715.1 hypothetical protein [Halomicroarcula salinisoli]